MFLLILLPLATALPQHDHYNGVNSSHPLSKRNANGNDISGFQMEILHATNEYRKSKGKQPLELSDPLNSSAQKWADTMKEKCLWEHMPNSPFPDKPWSENLFSDCKWTPDVTRTIEGWIESPGHNKNMLGDWTVMGIGFAKTQNCDKHCFGNKAHVVAAHYVKE